MLIPSYQKQICLSVCLALAACTTSPKTAQITATSASSGLGGQTSPAQFRVVPESAQDKIKRICSSNSFDWSSVHVHSRAIQQYKRQHFPSKSGAVNLGALKQLRKPISQSTQSKYALQTLSETYGSSFSSAKLNGFPCGDGAGHEWWIDDAGEVYIYTSGSATAPATSFHVQNYTNTGSTTDTFEKGSFSVYFDTSNGDTAGYLMSTQGNFYVIDLNVANVSTYGKTIDHHTMGGTNSNVPFAPPPYLDNSASVIGNNGTNTVYAITALGTLYRFVIDHTTKAISSTATASLAFHTGGSYTELFQCSPIVWYGIASVGSWKRYNGATRSFDRGYFYNEDVNNMASPTANTPAQTSISPFVISPSLDLDNNLATAWAFEPAGNHMNMYDIEGGGGGAQSSELVVNSNTSYTGNPDTENPSYVISGKGIENPAIIFDPDWLDGGANVADIYVVNCNALWKISYASAAYDYPNTGAQNPYDPLSTPDRENSFGDGTQTWYSLTSLGQSSGPRDANGYIRNVTQTAVDSNDLSTFYVIDTNANPDSSSDTASSINAFNCNRDDLTLPPTFNSSVSLSSIDSNAQVGGSGITSEYGASPTALLFNTHNYLGASTTNSQAWYFNN